MKLQKFHFLPAPLYALWDWLHNMQRILLLPLMTSLNHCSSEHSSLPLCLCPPKPSSLWPPLSSLHRLELGSSYGVWFLPHRVKIFSPWTKFSCSASSYCQIKLGGMRIGTDISSRNWQHLSPKYISLPNHTSGAWSSQNIDQSEWLLFWRNSLNSCQSKVHSSVMN